MSIPSFSLISSATSFGSNIDFPFNVPYDFNTGRQDGTEVKSPSLQDSIMLEKRRLSISRIVEHGKLLRDGDYFWVDGKARIYPVNGYCMSVNVLDTISCVCWSGQRSSSLHSKGLFVLMTYPNIIQPFYNNLGITPRHCRRNTDIPKTDGRYFEKHLYCGCRFSLVAMPESIQAVSSFH